MDDSDLTPTARFNRISEHGLCIGCGLCQSVAGAQRIRMVRTIEGNARPIPQTELDAQTVQRIYDVCPGTRIEGLPDHELTDETHVDGIWGPYVRIVRTYAAQPDVRHLGSTGGVLSALAIYLLESESVDFILHARASEREPTWGEQHLSYDRSAVIAGAGSRYGPSATLVELDRVLDRDRPFAFIGKPCDVAAMRNFARHEPRLDELCKYYLTLVCGGFMEPSGLRQFLAREGIESGEVVSFRYRGFGCPGPTRIETSDGRVIEKNYLDMWGEDESAWSLPFRCKICPDAIGEAADLAASDTWPGGSPTWEGQADDLGTNAVLLRTRRGLELLQAAVREGALVVEREVTARDMDDYQPHQVSKKQAVWARLAGLRRAGQLVPQVERLRIEELAREQGVSANLRQARGTLERARQGRGREPTPREF